MPPTGPRCWLGGPTRGPKDDDERRDARPRALAHGGTREPALLEQTIGDNLDATVARVPDRDALVDRAAGIRMTYAELGAEVDRLARGARGRRVEGRPRRHLGPELRRVGPDPVRHRQGRGDPRHINPAYRSHELGLRARQAGIRMLVLAPSFKSSDYVAMVAAVRDECPDLEHVVVFGQQSWTDASRRATR